MEYLIGIGLALGVGIFASLVGFERDRSFYPVVLVVIASTYDLFAVMGGSGEVIAAEVASMAVFVLISVIGLKTNLWLVVFGLCAHGVFDLFHGHVIDNPGVPPWWPAFCLSYDIAAGAYLAWRLRHPGRSGLQARPYPGAPLGHPQSGHESEVDK